MADLGLKPGIDYQTIAEGFVTLNGEFLDRYEAFDYVYKNCFICPTTKWYKEDKGERELYSEDLW